MIKRIVTAASLAIIAAFGASAQSGSWRGELNIGGASLSLVFNFSDKGCTLDSPDQGAEGIPTKWKYDPTGKVVVQIPVINGSFEGILAADSIPGKFSQNGYEFPLTLRPGEVRLNRPQTPQPPFPYTSVEVWFSNGDAALQGTLTLPRDFTPDTPAVIMVTGSGLQNRDEEAFGHKPFAVIADALARRGIATLRYDDRGYGKSTGNVKDCTVNDFKNDAAAGIAFLRNRFKNVGVLGHSEGGTIAMMLAGENAVGFAVSLAGMSIRGKDLLLKQNRDALADIGIKEDVIDAYCRHLADGMDSAIAGKEIEPVNDATLPAALNDNLNKALEQFRTPYMKSFIQLSGVDSLASSKVPLLALNGTKDTQVGYTENLSAIKAISGDRPYTIKTYDGLNHLFQHAVTGKIEEYSKIEETISPQVLEDIIAWIKSL